MEQLNPWWVIGFVDGEGTFYVWVNKHVEMSSWFQVLPEFRVVQHKRDIQLLHKLKTFFGCWVVRINHDTRYELRIRSITHLQDIVIPFFQKYSLQTKKKHDFIKFATIVSLMNQWKHLTVLWIEDIKKIASSMNTWSDKDIVHTTSKDFD